jgi:hypothetical protein
MQTEQGPVDMETVEKPSPALANPAIARCARAWEVAYRTQLEQKAGEPDALRKAGEAYRAALPPLSSRDNCRDFIACVAHGILLGSIDGKSSGKLLYAVQVALFAVASEEKSREMAGYAVYVNLTESETARVKKFMPQRSRTA